VSGADAEIDRVALAFSTVVSTTVSAPLPPRIDSVFATLRLWRRRQRQGVGAGPQIDRVGGGVQHRRQHDGVGPLPPRIDSVFATLMLLAPLAKVSVSLPAPRSTRSARANRPENLRRCLPRPSALQARIRRSVADLLAGPRQVHSWA